MNKQKEILPPEYCLAECIGINIKIEKIKKLMEQVMPYSWEAETKHAHGFYLELQDQVKTLEDRIQMIKDYVWDNHNIQLLINKKGA
tara:strand:- start:5296 stop:5556 length:261 start_codon:yes stop_codon:yes gene_type:complete